VFGCFWCTDAGASRAEEIHSMGCECATANGGTIKRFPVNFPDKPSKPTNSWPIHARNRRLVAFAN